MKKQINLSTIKKPHSSIKNANKLSHLIFIRYDNNMYMEWMIANRILSEFE